MTRSLDASPQPVQLETILALSRDLEEKAQHGNWQLAAELAERRNTLLENLFAGGGKAINLLPVREILTEIRGIDDRVRDLAAKRKHAVVKELDSLSTGRQAADAYAAHRS